MVSTEDLAFLKEVLPFWRDLPEKQQKVLSEEIRTHSFSAGSALHSGAEDCSGLFIVKNGRIRAFILSESGKEVTLYRLFERDVCFFSASCVMHDIRFDILVEAETQTDALLIPTYLYEELIENSISASNFMNRLLASRMSDVMWLVEQVMFKKFDTRLAHFLIEQSNIEGSDNIPITHESIAKNLGTAREVVSRMLKHFEAEGIVTLYRGGTRIKDRRKLIEIADRID